MKNLFYISVFIVFYFWIPVQSVAQNYSQNNLQNDTEFDSRLLLHYSAEELNNLKNQYPADFENICYYHLSSYVILISDPQNDFLNQFDLKEFDITLYESSRLLNDVYELDFDKYGIKIQLIPYNELEYLTPLQQLYKTKLEE